MRILVLGGTGSIGAAVVRELVNRRHASSKTWSGRSDSNPQLWLKDSSSKRRLIINRLTIHQQALDRGRARWRDGSDNLQPRLCGCSIFFPAESPANRRRPIGSGITRHGALPLESADQGSSHRPADQGRGNWPAERGRGNRPADHRGRNWTPNDIHAGIPPQNLIRPARRLRLLRAALPRGYLAGRTTPAADHPIRRGALGRRLVRHAHAASQIPVHVGTAACNARSGNDRHSALSRPAGFSVRAEQTVEAAGAVGQLGIARGTYQE